MDPSTESIRSWSIYSDEFCGLTASNIIFSVVKTVSSFFPPTWKPLLLRPGLAARRPGSQPSWDLLPLPHWNPLCLSCVGRPVLVTLCLLLPASLSCLFNFLRKVTQEKKFFWELACLKMPLFYPHTWSMGWPNIEFWIKNNFPAEVCRHLVIVFWLLMSLLRGSMSCLCLVYLYAYSSPPLEAFGVFPATPEMRAVLRIFFNHAEHLTDGFNLETCSPESFPVSVLW